MGFEDDEYKYLALSYKYLNITGPMNNLLCKAMAALNQLIKGLEYWRYLGHFFICRNEDEALATEEIEQVKTIGA
jgi:hypothetical protein